MVIIKKDGFWTDDGENRIECIVPHLREPVEVDDDVTLLDVFNAVEGHPDLLQFITQYSWCDKLLEFHKQAREPYDPAKDKEPLTHLELYWHPQYSREKDFRLHPGFHGRKMDMPYSVSYSPMYELAHLTIQINDVFKVYSRNIKSPTVIFEGRQAFTLLEFLDAIYDDISFMGGPEENAEFIEEMKDRIDKITSGEVPLEYGDIEDLIGEEGLEDLFGDLEDDG